MNPEHWQKIERIFQRALELEPEERAVYIQETCGDDLALQKEIESLLDSHQSADSWFRDSSSTDPVSFGRYQNLEFIGQGGMARVYKAYDPTLRRIVALKLLRVDHPDHKLRLLAEARAQARIEHPNVCKVYEAGELEGKPYIAMQYISGDILKIAAGALDVEQKVKLFEEIAEAVHAAHRAGLIHRDIKPANVMIQQNENGECVPFIMDFGIAREMLSPGTTRTGAFVGSPNYMSPEQILKSPQGLDRRSDIYNIGVTLYEALTGELPIDLETAPTVFAGIMDSEAVPLRRRNPDIPRDLETIVMKCLQKEPDRRYDSARALSEDLRRYLNGEPIHARPPSLLDRLVKKSKKHRGIAILAIVALFLVLASSFVALRARRNVQKQVELAQRFGQEAKDIEWMMRVARTEPQHDIRPQQKKMIERMKWIEGEMTALGDVAYVSGHHALGRGYLALRKYEEAREHLQKSWEAGYHSPALAYDLGRTLGELYKNQLEEIQKIRGAMLREKRQKEIERTYRDPALRYLRTGNVTQMEAPDFVEALIAFYENKYPVALEKTRKAFQQSPSLYEAKKLEGDIVVAKGYELERKGQYNEALQQYAQAGEAYRAGSNFARSDDVIYEADCGRWNRVMKTLSLQRKPPDDAFREALSACDQALKVNPENGKAFNKKAQAYYRQGEYLIHQDLDPGDRFQQAIRLSERAIQLSPQDPSSYRTEALAYMLQATHQLDHELSDPEPSLDQGIRKSLQALRISPRYVLSYNDLCYAYEIKAEHRRLNGKDPRPSIQQGLGYCTEAAEMDPEDITPLNTIGLIYKQAALYESESGLDPSVSFRKAVEAYEKAAAVNRNYIELLGNIGSAYADLAQYEISQKKNAEQSLQRAIENSLFSIKEDPGNSNARMNLGLAYWLKGCSELEGSISPKESLQKARDMIQESLRLNPNDINIYVNLGQIEIAFARWEMQKHRSPQSFLKNAQDSLNRGLAKKSNYAELYQVMGRSYRWQAEWKLSQGQSIQQTVQQGLTMLDKALSINPHYAEACAEKAALYTLLAKSETNPTKRHEAASQAKDAIEKALTMNKNLTHEYGFLRTENEKLLSASGDIEAGFPLSQGTVWIYKAILKWKEQIPGHSGTTTMSDHTLKKEIDWRMEILETVVRNDTTAAIVSGYPADLADYTGGPIQPSSSILVRIAGKRFYRFALKGHEAFWKQLKSGTEISDNLKKELEEGELFFELPLFSGKFFGVPENRGLPGQGWIVESEQSANLHGIKRVPQHTKAKQYLLHDGYNTSDEYVTLVPELGIVEFEHDHHAQSLQTHWQLKLIEYRLVSSKSP